MLDLPTWRGWTPEAVDLLRKRYAEALPYSAIAKELGCDRGAVIGKSHRIGLPKRGGGKAGGVSAAERRLIAAEKRREKRRAKAMTSVSKKARPMMAAEQLPPEPVASVEPLRVPLVELQSGDCRWPTDERPWRFCGHPALLGTSWCQCHHAIVYNRAPAASYRAPRV